MLLRMPENSVLGLLPTSAALGATLPLSAVCVSLCVQADTGTAERVSRLLGAVVKLSVATALGSTGWNTGTVSASKKEAFSPSLLKPPKTSSGSDVFGDPVCSLKKGSQDRRSLPPVQTCFLLSKPTPPRILLGSFLQCFKQIKHNNSPRKQLYRI